MSDENKEFESPYWHGKKPFVEFVLAPWPWRPRGVSSFNAAVFAHRALFGTDPLPSTTALVREGPKAIVLVRK